MIDKRTFGEHIARSIRLSEHYLAIPDQEEIAQVGISEEEFDRIQRENLHRHQILDRAIQKAVDARKAFLDCALTNDIRKNQEEALSIGRTLLDRSEFNSRQKLIIEYELSFLGINPVTVQIFTPIIIHYLTNQAYREKAVISTEITEGARELYRKKRIDPEEVIVHHQLIDDMSYFEKARWSYSRDDEYAGKTDLSDRIWCRPETFTELTDEIAEFLEKKKRVLEVGFLHQRIYDIIMNIKPTVEYHGVDISIPAVQIARKKGITAFNSNCWYAIPYPDSYFDGIICSTVKASGLYPSKSHEMKRVLKNPKEILNFDLR